MQTFLSLALPAVLSLVLPITIFIVVPFFTTKVLFKPVAYATFFRLLAILLAVFLITSIVLAIYFPERIFVLLYVVFSSLCLGYFSAYRLRKIIKSERSHDRS